MVVYTKAMVLRKILLILLILFLFGVSAWGSFYYFSQPKKAILSTVSSPAPKQNLSTSAVPYSFEAAPSQSQQASVISQSGEVSSISRIATEAATLMQNTLQQGESILTGTDGRVEIQFPASDSATLAEKSQLNLIQTLQNKIVLEHVGGVIRYRGTLSIRAKRLLVVLQNAEMTITYDSKKDLVQLSVHTGSVTTAYNDTKFVSQVQTISAGHSAVFNNTKRKLIVK